MKKYIQYNAAQYASTPAEVASRPPSTVKVGEKPKDDCSGVVLDLSGKNGNPATVPMATGRKWNGEQDSALDLSNSSNPMGRESQAEALDLSKPSTSRPDTMGRLPFPTSTGIHRSGPPLSMTPPTSNVTRPSIGQYSLLQAALNSTQPNTVLHPSLTDTANLDSRARMIAALAALEVSRGIKPFAPGGPRPFGLSVPPLAYPNTPVTVIQGVHKPMAITAPQPHISNAESKSQTSSHTTFSVSDSHQMGHNSENGVRKMQYVSGTPRPASDKLLLQESYRRDAAERYVLNTQNHLNRPTVTDSPKVIQFDKRTDNFKCLQCGKVYKTKAALKLHATVHKTSEERQYECPLCKRRFLHRHHLVVHQRKHSGEKPYKCDACAKSFMAIFLLHKHLRKHVRESGPSCQIASEQLAQLNVKKDTIDVSGIEKISMTYPKEVQNISTAKRQVVILDDDTILPLNDAEKLSKLKELNLTLLNKKKAEEFQSKRLGVEVIDLSSDDLNSSHGSGMDKNLALKASNVSDSSIVGEIKSLSQETSPNRNIQHHVSDNKQVTPVDRITKVQSNQHIPSPSAVHIDIKSININPGDTVTSQDKEEVTVNPFPSYTSDDEVELDFETGELKVISKVNNSSDHNMEAGKTSASTADSDNKDSLSSDSGNKGDIGSHSTGSPETSANKTQNETSGKENTECDKVTSENSSHVLTHPANKTDVSDGPVHISKTEQKDNLSLHVLKPDKSQHAPTKSDRNIFDEVGNGLKYIEKDRMIKPDGSERTESENVLNSIINQVEQCENGKNPGSLPIPKHFDRNCGSETKRTTSKKCRKKVKRVKCEVCSRTFHSSHHLILHMAVHKKNQMLQSLKKAKVQQMKSMGYQQQKTSVVCHICKKIFKFQKSLNSHMRVHSEKMAQRKLISKAFRDFMLEASPSYRTSERTPSMSSESHLVSNNNEPSQINDNNNTAIDDKILSNDPCDLHTGCIEYLDQYSKNDRLEDPPIKVIIGKDNIKRYLCHACDNTYTTKQKLRMHALIHKDNCFLCDICGKSFFRLLTLEKHIATHKLPRPHVCSECKKSFIHRSSLMRHKVIHEKPNPPTAKQQVEDINFELKMLDTYTMLRQERLQKLQNQNTNMNEPGVDPMAPTPCAEVKADTEDKSNILDLSVRIKTDPDVSLPPVLSPANTPNSMQQNPLHLSPPVITGESCHSNEGEIQEPDNSSADMKLEPMELSSIKGENPAESQVVEKCVEPRKKRNSDEMFGSKDAINNDTFYKKSRKTRVYQTSCRVCKEKFPNVMTLKSHMSVHNMVETHLYECNVCHHRFTQSCSLLRHLKTSCQENRLKCLPCGKTFHQKHSYDQHMKLHNGIPPNLDGSFYDKRKDEVEGIQVKEERESDIENNNTTKVLAVSQVNPVKVDPVNTHETLKSEITLPYPIESVKSEIKPCQSVEMDLSVVKPGPSVVPDTNYDSDGSEAKTYLYSEGEGRVKDMADFSDLDDIPAKVDLTKQPAPRPQSVESVASSGVMTLNLLSAVCSDIRNAEKEEETRRREMEERQKELETIEILANLKRGRMQNKGLSSSSAQELPNAPMPCEKPVPSSFDSNNVTKPIVHNQEVTSGLPERSETNKPGSLSKGVVDSSAINIKNEPKNILNIPQIPTVVFEIAAEAERLRQERLAKMGHADVKPAPPRSQKEESKPAELSSQAHFLQGLSQMTLHDRLSLLMKAQFAPSTSVTGASVSTHPTPLLQPPPPSTVNKPSPLVTTYTLTRPQSVPSSSPLSSGHPQQPKNNAKLPPQAMPQDLSMKKPLFPIPSASPSLSAFPLSSPPSSLSSPFNSSGNRMSKVTETGPRVPGLVPVFHCELCGKMIYNQIEYQLHLQEHLHAIQLKGHSLMAQHGHPGQRSWILDRAQNLASFTSQALQREPASKVIPSMSTPPTSIPHTVTPHTGTPPTSIPHTGTPLTTIPHTGTPHIGTPSINTPPSTLDLTLRKPSSILGITQDLLSPITSSDFSNDTIPSPSTPSSTSAGMNLDVLRKELRNKIYARRKSQGLEELTVEFKSPEPSEMTEEERAKLDYRRECNRQAAQRSRMRKKDLVDSLIEELQEEEIVNSDLRRKLESLLAEKNYLLKALESHACVKDKGKLSSTVAGAMDDARPRGPKEDDQLA